MAAIRVRDQGAARLRAGDAAPGSPRHRPGLSLLRGPGPFDMLRRRADVTARPLLSVDLRADPASAIEERPYWSMDFPDRGARDDDDTALLRDFERTLLAAVERRLRADVPVVCYVSGGIDSSIVAAMASKIRGAATPTFTVQVTAAGTTRAARRPSSRVTSGRGRRSYGSSQQDLVHTYPELIRAAEAPVIDTASAATLMLAREVHQAGIQGRPGW